MDKGVVVDLGNDIEGFVPISQLGIPNIENPGGSPNRAAALSVSLSSTRRASSLPANDSTFCWMKAASSSWTGSSLIGRPTSDWNNRCSPATGWLPVGVGSRGG
jgi:hypothetical protein